MTTSAYIHIPFCKSKCKYCSFVSYAGKSGGEIKDYTDTLIQEIEHFYKDEPLETLYFGGGTPSLLKTDDVKKILAPFKFAPNAEITFEVNPETVDIEYLYALRETGINRLSIGIQSFEDPILKSIGRLHNAQKAIQTLIEAQKAGFTNLSADFIYGLPKQTQEGFIKDLKTAADAGAKHISLYGLKIEEGCEFSKRPPHKNDLPDDDAQADMYLAAIETLEPLGFSHYEISNFAKKGFSSRHNLNYWNCCEYYGFGAAAHGFIGGVRYSNHACLKEFKKNYPQKDTLEALNKKERLDEAIFLGFRRGWGINTSVINQNFEIDFEKVYNDVLQKYLESKHILKTENGYKLSNTGFLLSNIILSDFI